MKPCRWAGAPCPNEGATTIRLAGVGDRALCADHLATATRMGMAFRRLDEDAPAPAWRQRDLTRDMTGAQG